MTPVSELTLARRYELLAEARIIAREFQEAIDLLPKLKEAVFHAERNGNPVPPDVRKSLDPDTQRKGEAYLQIINAGIEMITMSLADDEAQAVFSRVGAKR